MKSGFTLSLFWNDIKDYQFELNSFNQVGLIILKTQMRFQSMGLEVDSFTVILLGGWSFGFVHNGLTDNAI